MGSAGVACTLGQHRMDKQAGGYRVSMIQAMGR